MASIFEQVLEAAAEAQEEDAGFGAGPPQAATDDEPWRLAAHRRYLRALAAAGAQGGPGDVAAQLIIGKGNNNNDNNNNNIDNDNNDNNDNIRKSNHIIHNDKGNGSYNNSN